jgi:hypothetical protein
MRFNSDAASIPEGVVIRRVLLGMALAMLLAGVDMAMAQTRAGGEQRVVKNDARLPRSPMRSDLPVATAYVAADGRVQVMPVERMDDITGSIGNTPPRLCNALQDLKPAELRKLSEQIAGDEGVPADLVAAILRIEQRSGAEVSASGVARLTIGLPTGNEDCLPAVTLRAGIRRLKDLGARYPERMHLLGAYHAGEDVILATGGVPTSPETLRFVAEVMNELAGGLTPQPNRRHSVPARRIAGAEPAPRPSLPPSPSRTAGDPRWASGFVLNIE